MKRSIIPGFIKRRSIISVKPEEQDSVDLLLKETDRSHQLSAECATQEKHGVGFYSNNNISLTYSDFITNYDNHQDREKICLDEELIKKQTEHRTSIYEGIFCGSSDSSFVIPIFYNNTQDCSDGVMVDQEDIIALTRHVRNFSDALSNLKNTFKESCNDGVYNEVNCQSSAHSRLSDVLTILKGVLAKYPPLHSPDILTAAANIINKIKTYNYSDGADGPTDFYAAIDQLALSFSSSVSDYLMGDKEMTSHNSGNTAIDQYDEDGDLDGDEEYDPKFFSPEDDEESEKFESEDSLDRLQGSYDLQKNASESVLPDGFENSPPSKNDSKVKLESPSQRTDELDKTLLSIEGSVDIALQRTKVWAKYAKDILNYIEKRSQAELEFSRSTARLATQARNNIMEESYLPFQSIYVTALDNDIQFANNYHKSRQAQLQKIVDELTQRLREHDNKRSKIKRRWKAESQRLNESRENLRVAKRNYIQKQKDLERFNKQQLEGKDDKGFSLGKKKGQEDFKKSAEESEDHYKQCVDEANASQQEIERTKADILLELRQLVYQCDSTMKNVTVDYFQMMNLLLSPLPIQYRALVDSSNQYEEGQQFADFVRLQQSTCNQAMYPTYHFEQYRGEGTDRFHVNSESARPPSPGGRKIRQAWGTVPRNKGSATDDTDSLSSHSLPGTPTGSPTISRKGLKASSATEIYSDEDPSDLKDAIMKNSKQMPGLFKNQKLSAAAKMHKFRKLRSPSKCKECDSYVYFNGAECERCGLMCHRKCLEKLAIKCGNKRLPRKMTTFGVDFHQHLAATKRKDIPYIIEKCIDATEESGLSAKGIYRVSGVKSKMEKLCQRFETGGDLVDLSTTPPHLVASVLKLYLRQLPEPLLTFKLYDAYIKVAKESMNLNLAELDQMNEQDSNQYEEIISELHGIIKKLPEANFYTAAKLMRHLKRVSENIEENQMSVTNLAIVLGPTLLRPEKNPDPLAAVMDMSFRNRTVELLILNCHMFSVNSEGEIDIVTLTGEKYRATSKTQKKPNVPTTITEHKQQDSVSAEFSQELLFIMESSQKLMDEDREKNESHSPGQLPGQAIDNDNNPRIERESDILNDLPDVTKPVKKKSSVTSEDNTADYESCNSRLDSVDSLLSGDVDFDQNSPVHLPDASQEEIDDDDVWMNRFGQGAGEKEPVLKTRSASQSEMSKDSSDAVPHQPRQKHSSFSKLETTTYSFSLGNTMPKENTKELGEGDKPTSPVSPDDIGPSVWVKRDSRERVPVRKHLKTVNIKSSSAVVSVECKMNESGELVPNSLKSTPFSLADTNSKTGNDNGDTLNNRERITSTTSTDSETENQQLVLKVGLLSKQLRQVPENEESVAVPTSPSKMAPPAVLPKPRKPLEKKSWTADLIKSKAQSIPEQPHPGSLNDKLLSRRSEETKSEENKPAKSVTNKSVKEIRTKFQATPVNKDDISSEPPINVGPASQDVDNNNSSV